MMAANEVVALDATLIFLPGIKAWVVLVFRLLLDLPPLAVLHLCSVSDHSGLHLQAIISTFHFIIYASVFHY